MFETKIPYPLSKKAKFCNSSQNFLHVNFPFLNFANFVNLFAEVKIFSFQQKMSKFSPPIFAKIDLIENVCEVEKFKLSSLVGES
jgi:hypothetical protein